LVWSSQAFQRQNSTKEKSFTDFGASPRFFSVTRWTSAFVPMGTKWRTSARRPFRSPVICE
jgi:hypothetical protein